MGARVTIAVCYLTAEGVVFGADSTTTMAVPSPDGTSAEQHHFNFGQKVFEIGAKESSLGIVTWGLGGLGSVSYRTLFALLGDDLAAAPATTMDEIAARWIGIYWKAYEGGEVGPFVAQARTLDAMPVRDALHQKELDSFRQDLTAGFCIGGLCLPGRQPAAFYVVFEPTMKTPPAPVPIAMGEARFWGVPNIITRMIRGYDPHLPALLMASKWSGTADELDSVLGQVAYGHPSALPLREAIDWTYSSIQATIKVLKFSHFSPIAGGPVELAVVSTDRPFRWVRHKKFGSAIATGDQEAL